ncbi:hypothetical protein QTG54_015902 [Skeletonema marinoi]|uniref:Uncharacterized protein n=1 Tax=Skeletonema marinoi TaxID=267567 RepID=A0AAD8XTG2_9STRA|nr:hypothetical protein QTG54_015902 [Skeletonema marinoi]
MNRHGAGEPVSAFQSCETASYSPGVTRVRIDESVTVIPARHLWKSYHKELDCHDGVKTVEEMALHGCRSLRRVIMRGVEVVERNAFNSCTALMYVECDKLERIGRHAFCNCKSLTSINLPSAKIVEDGHSLVVQP